MEKKLVIICAVVTAVFLAGPAMAVPVMIEPVDTPSQDPLVISEYVHELGLIPPFPTNEAISSSFVTTDYRPCLENPDLSSIANVEVTITNLSGRAWYNLHYVADPETSLMNDDGLINSELAFKIDWIGANTPLIFESMAADTVFEVGETWKFVIQDYVNAFALPPSAFGSLAAVGVTSGGDSFSSGSIVAEVPEPATLCLLGLGGLLLRRWKRA